MPNFARTFIRNSLSVKPARVECTISNGLPSFAIVGAKDTAVRETRERIRAAILNESFDFPQARITISIEPSTDRYFSPSLDLAIAASILLASDQVREDSIASHPLIGELSLDGSVRPVHGTITCSKNSPFYFDKPIVVPFANRGEARAIAHSDAIAISRLGEIALTADELLGLYPYTKSSQSVAFPPQGPDLKDLRGHTEAIRALTIAAAGSHNILFIGAPGCGKTMLARRLPSVLPAFTFDEQLEVTEIQSATGLLRVDGLAETRPFRAPHHSISAAGLVGSYKSRFPGELTLAHRGVLFLDELDQFASRVIEMIPPTRPSSSRTVSVGNCPEPFPCDFLLAAAVNPCPCGAGDRKCRCSEADIARFNQRFSSPFIEGFDLFVPVTRPTPADVEDGPLTDSAEQRSQVESARSAQTTRYAGTQIRTNAELDSFDTRSYVDFDSSAAEMLREATATTSSPEVDVDRTLRVAQTIADLSGASQVSASHVTEALSFTRSPYSRVPASQPSA